MSNLLVSSRLGAQGDPPTLIKENNYLNKRILEEKKSKIYIHIEI